MEPSKLLELFEKYRGLRKDLRYQHLVLFSDGSGRIQHGLPRREEVVADFNTLAELIGIMENAVKQNNSSRVLSLLRTADRSTISICGHPEELISGTECRFDVVYIHHQQCRLDVWQKDIEDAEFTDSGIVLRSIYGQRVVIKTYKNKLEPTWKD
jgi:hypothetical protein